jgi:hypothetical protein
MEYVRVLAVKKVPYGLNMGRMIIVIGNKSPVEPAPTRRGTTFLIKNQ